VRRDRRERRFELAELGDARCHRGALRRDVRRQQSEV
jgi:hypothetical protein